MLEQAITDQANVRTFRYSTTDIKSWYKFTGSYDNTHFTDNTKALAFELKLKASERFVVEVGYDAKVV